MLIVFIFGALSFFLGTILSFASYKLSLKDDSITEKINELLPQSQCAQCGYSGCYPYAKAIIKNSERIDKCVPGGDEIISEISKILNIEYSIKSSAIKKKEIFKTTAWIDEKNCIGCAKCATFCPVDAIIGAPNFIHTVLQDFCTGCNICLLHCPTNCIKIKKNNHENK